MVPVDVANRDTLASLGRVLAPPELRGQIIDSLAPCELLRFERCVCRLLSRSLLIGRPLMETLDFSLCQCGCDRRLMHLLSEAFARETEYLGQRILKLKVRDEGYRERIPFVRDRLLCLCNSLVERRLRVLDLPDCTIRASELAVLAARGWHSLEFLSAGLRFDPSAETWEECLPDSGAKLQSLLEHKLREGCRSFYDRQAGEHSVGWFDEHDVWHELFYVDNALNPRQGFLTALELIARSNPQALRHVVTRSQLSRLPELPAALRTLRMTGISQSLAIPAFEASSLRELSLTFGPCIDCLGKFCPELHCVEGVLHRAPALRYLSLRGMHEATVAQILNTYPGSMTLEELDLDVIGNDIVKAISGRHNVGEQTIRCPRLQLVSAQFSKIGPTAAQEICEAVKERRLPLLQKLLLCVGRTTASKPGESDDVSVVLDESLIPSEHRLTADSLISWSSWCANLQEIRLSLSHKELRPLKAARRSSDGSGWRVLYLWPAVPPQKTHVPGRHDSHDDRVVRTMHMVRNHGSPGSPLFDFESSNGEGDTIKQPRPVLFGTEGVQL